MTHSYRVHFFHLIWSTKGRSPVLTKAIQGRLYPYMGAVISKRGGRLLEVGGMPDHVHALLEISNLENFSPLIRDIKSHSTLWLNREIFPQGPKFSWQEGYGSFTVSFSQVDVVKNYIRNQESHHTNYTFEEEYLGLLKRHQVQVDERFVLG